MAIRYTRVDATSAGAAQVCAMSGWRMVDSRSNISVSIVVNTAGMWQPSALTRPSNCPGPYQGAWDENVTGPYDKHRPIPFKTCVSLPRRPLQVQQRAHL